MPQKTANRIYETIEKLTENPDRTDLDTRPLVNRPGFRLRIGDWRIIYSRDDVIRIVVERIAPRGEAYKK